MFDDVLDSVRYSFCSLADVAQKVDETERYFGSQDVALKLFKRTERVNDSASDSVENVDRTIPNDLVDAGNKDLFMS